MTRVAFWTILAAACVVVAGTFVTGCSKSASEGPQPSSSIVYVTPTQSEVATSGAGSVEGTATSGGAQGSAGDTEPLKSQPGDEKTVQLVGVGLSGEGNMVVVAFRTDPAIARKWRQGNVYVVDEATGQVYGQIPVMPIIGPLLTRPARKEQVGNVMFQNTGMGLRSGSKVTVVLGGYKREHLTLP